MKAIEHQKDWGVTRCLCVSADSEVWHASIRRGGRSSWHRHNRKDNHFYVMSGELVIDEEWHENAVAAFSKIIVPAGSWHQFRALTDVELIEVYWAVDGSVIDPNDIERREAEVTHGR